MRIRRLLSRTVGRHDPPRRMHTGRAVHASRQHLSRRPHRHHERRPAVRGRRRDQGREDPRRRHRRRRHEVQGDGHAGGGPRGPNDDSRLHRRARTLRAVRRAGDRCQPARFPRWRRQHHRRPRRRDEARGRDPGHRAHRLGVRHRLRRRHPGPAPDAGRPRQGLHDDPDPGRPHLGALQRAQLRGPEAGRLHRGHAGSQGRHHPSPSGQPRAERRQRGERALRLPLQRPLAEDARGGRPLPPEEPRARQELRLHHRERGPRLSRQPRRRSPMPRSGGCSTSTSSVTWTTSTAPSSTASA